MHKKYMHIAIHQKDRLVSHAVTRGSSSVTVQSESTLRKSKPNVGPGLDPANGEEEGRGSHDKSSEQQA